MKTTILNLAVLFFLMAIMIAPGIMFTEVLAHEFYHWINHQDTAEEICIDINQGSVGHVTVNFAEEEIDPAELQEEERKANIFGKMATIIYVVNALVVMNWIFFIMISERKRKVLGKRR